MISSKDYGCKVSLQYEFSRELSTSKELGMVSDSIGIHSSLVLDPEHLYIDLKDMKTISVIERLGCVMRKPAFCKCENKGTDQLHGNGATDQLLCFLYIDSTIPILPKSGISSLLISSVAAQPGLCLTRKQAFSRPPHL